MPLTALGVIPARLASTRFPAKPLAPILGRPMIFWVIDAVLACKKINHVCVATDDLGIKKVVQDYGCSAVMTSSDHLSGSDRVWEAAKDQNFDIVVNIQGDEPLLRPQLLELLVSAFDNQPNLKVATLSQKTTRSDLDDKNKVKVLTDRAGHAIYFSRFPIPFSRIDSAAVLADPKTSWVGTHVGLYAYRKSFLGQYVECGVTEFETAESLEQLRVLWMGERMKVIPVPTALDGLLYGVDRPEDIKVVEDILKVSLKI